MVSSAAFWVDITLEPLRFRPKPLNKSWSWYVDLQLLLIEFLLTRRGLEVTEARNTGFCGMFEVELEI